MCFGSGDPSNSVPLAPDALCRAVAALEAVRSLAVNLDELRIVHVGAKGFLDRAKVRFLRPREALPAIIRLSTARLVTPVTRSTERIELPSHAPRPCRTAPPAHCRRRRVFAGLDDGEAPRHREGSRSRGPAILTALDTLAAMGGSPAHIMAGNVKRTPPPATALQAPAMRPAAKRTVPSRSVMVALHHRTQIRLTLPGADALRPLRGHR